MLLVLRTFFILKEGGLCTIHTLQQEGFNSKSLKLLFTIYQQRTYHSQYWIRSKDFIIFVFFIIPSTNLWTRGLQILFTILRSEHGISSFFDFQRQQFYHEQNNELDNSIGINTYRICLIEMIFTKFIWYCSLYFGSLWNCDWRIWIWSEIEIWEIKETCEI